MSTYTMTATSAPSVYDVLRMTGGGTPKKEKATSGLGGLGARIESVGEAMGKQTEAFKELIVKPARYGLGFWPNYFSPNAFSAAVDSNATQVKDALAIPELLPRAGKLLQSAATTFESPTLQNSWRALVDAAGLTSSSVDTMKFAARSIVPVSAEGLKTASTIGAGALFVKSVDSLHTHATEIATHMPKKSAGEIEKMSDPVEKKRALSERTARVEESTWAGWKLAKWISYFVGSILLLSTLLLNVSLAVWVIPAVFTAVTVCHIGGYIYGKTHDLEADQTKYTKPATPLIDATAKA